MKSVRTWLLDYDWDFVTAQNLLLCHAKNALHKPTSDDYDRIRALRESRHHEPMALDEAADLCRRCHRLAPFC